VNPASLQLATDVLIPALGSISDLVARLIDGTRSLASASAELRNVLTIALVRLDHADAAFAKRDAAEDARVAAHRDDTKP